MVNTLLILIVVAGLLGLFALVALLLRRRSLSFQLVIIGDNRRNGPPGVKLNYNMRVGSQNQVKAVKLYNNLISFSAAKVMTEIADPRPFVWYGRTCFGIIGPTGGIEDDNIILVPRPKLTNLDVERWAMMHSDKIRFALQPVIAKLGTPEALSKEDTSKFVNETFTEQWVLKNEGAGQNFIKRDDVLPRSIKVAYTSEIKNAYNNIAKHQDAWSKLMQYAPIIILVVMIIGLGIFYDMTYSAFSKWTSSANAAQLQMYTFEQAQSYAIGHALSIAGIYGYNYSPTVPTPIVSPSITGGVTLPGLSVPTVPSTG